MKKYKSFIITICAMGLCLIALIVMELIKVNYEVVAPATISNIDKVYDFEGYDEDDINIYSVSVVCYEKISLFQYLIGKTNKYAKVEELSPLTITDLTVSNASGVIQKNVSLTNALIAGYNLASPKDSLEYEYNGEIVHTVYSYVYPDIRSGDVITKVDDTILTKDVSFRDYWLNKYRETGNSNLTFKLHILRNETEFDYDAHLYIYTMNGGSYITIGMSTYQYYTIKPESTLKYKIYNPDTTGPSAGLMQSLFVYEALSKEELTKNLKIVGTGTVDVDGTAGAIGGIESKIVTAITNNVDIFFCPSDNYEEALKTYKKYHTDMVLVKVSTLNDVITYLRSLKDENNK